MAIAVPSARWVEKQARSVCIAFQIAYQDEETEPAYLIRDGGAKFTKHFDEIFQSEGV